MIIMVLVLVSVLCLFPGRTASSRPFRCSIKYLTVPNSSHLRHCACAISQSLVRRCLFNIYFFGYVTLRLGSSG